MAGLVLMTPRQLGPTTLRSCFLPTSMTFFSNSTPSPPTSLNPAVMMITPLIPLAAASSMTLGTRGAGTMRTAMSTGSGISPRVG